MSAAILPELPYFYGGQAEQFAFYRIPKVFFTMPVFSSLSTDAKVLYGLMLDRMQLSARNEWLDEQGRVYIYYTLENIKRDLGCGDQKAVKLLAELDSKYGLIERKRQGLGKPMMIFVKDFSAVLLKSQVQTDENHKSGVMKITSQDLRKSQTNNTEKNNTYMSETESIHLSGQDGCDAMDEYEDYRNYFMDTLAIPSLLQDYPCDQDVLNEMLELIVETVCSKKPFIRIGGEDKPVQIVKNRLMKLDSEHIRYVLDCLRKNTTKVRNIRQYLLTSLYNASGTISSYYTALVNHDLYGTDNQ